MTKLSANFNPGALTVESAADTEIVLRAQDGKPVKAMGRKDMVPVSLGLDEEYHSFMVVSPEQHYGAIRYGSAVEPFMRAAITMLNTNMNDYFNAVHFCIARIFNVDLEGSQKGDGFVMDPDDIRITMDNMKKIQEELDKQYPLGPITPQLYSALLVVADEHLQRVWDKGDNYKVFCGHLIQQCLDNYLNRVNATVQEHMLGPIVDIAQHNERLAEFKKNKIVDQTGSAINSVNISKIVGLDGKPVKPTDIN